MKTATLKMFPVGAVLWIAHASVADNMIMARVPLRAEIVLEYVKASVEEHGYTVAHPAVRRGMQDSVVN